MSKPLPARPNLEQLKKQAKDLLKSLRAADPEALRRFQVSHLEGNLSTGFAPKGVRLADAQGVVAREYGFASWRKLKEHVESMAEGSADPVDLLKQAFVNDNASEVRRLLESHPELKAKINERSAAFGAPPIHHARSREMLDVLLAAGADINAKSNWWAGGFAFLHCASLDLANYAIQRGATVDIHAAARLGMLDRLRRLVEDDPALVHMRGGDGQTPLHFARTIETAAYLLDHGADIEARDVDHESTPAQYMVRDRQPILRYLIQRGCKTDLLMAAALGDFDLARKQLEADPTSVRLRVSDEFFPMINPKSGGTIYQWTLGWYVSAPQVAKDFGHTALSQWLMEQSPVETRLVNACWMDDEALVEKLVNENAGITARLSNSDRRQIAHAARNDDLPAVRLFLRAGWAVTETSQHGATALHWAAWHGNAQMVELLLTHTPPLEPHDRDFDGTPLRWAIHGSENGWHREKGDYPAVVDALLKAGAIPPDKLGGTPSVQAALRRRGVSGPTSGN